METAGATLANTPELIEIILLNLPLPSILQAQRVNWTFKNIISSSPRLQQALFFRPISVDSVPFNHDGSNILGCTSQDHGDRDEKTSTELNEDSNPWMWSGSSSRFSGHLLLNPWLAKCTPMVPTTSSGPFFQQIDTSVLDLAADDVVQPSFMKMLFTQPPVAGLIVHHRVAGRWHSLEASDPARGLTGQDVLQSVRAFDQEEFIALFKNGCFRGPRHGPGHPRLGVPYSYWRRWEGSGGRDTSPSHTIKWCEGI